MHILNLAHDTILKWRQIRMKQYLIIPDLHVPFHDLRYIRIISKVISIIKPYGIVQLGDALDFFQISRFEKDPERKNSIFDDIAIYRQILDVWEKALPPGGEIHQLEGNHEQRLTRYVWAQAREISRAVKPLPELLSLKSKKIIYKWHPLKIWSSCKIGDCILHHGHYFNQHVAVSNLTRYPKKLITGHTHRFQFAANGERFSATLGHGSNEDMTAHTPAPTSWQQAFGILTVINSISFFEAVIVQDGRCVINGECVFEK